MIIEMIDDSLVIDRSTTSGALRHWPHIDIAWFLLDLSFVTFVLKATISSNVHSQKLSVLVNLKFLDISSIFKYLLYTIEQTQDIASTDYP